jgi:hypothetical protein
MKASTYKQQARGQKMSRCDKKLGVTRVTPKPNRGREQLSLLTRMCKKRVTPSVGVTKVDLLGVTSVNGILICTSFGTLKCTTFHLS